MTYLAEFFKGFWAYVRCRDEMLKSAGYRYGRAVAHFISGGY